VFSVDTINFVLRKIKMKRGLKLKITFKESIIFVAPYIVPVALELNLLAYAK
jgi:hypothetical protein